MTLEELANLSDEEREHALLAAIAAWDARDFVSRALARGQRDEDDARGPGYDSPDDNGLMWEDYQVDNRGKKL